MEERLKPSWLWYARSLNYFMNTTSDSGDDLKIVSSAVAYLLFVCFFVLLLQANGYQKYHKRTPSQGNFCRSKRHV